MAIFSKMSFTKEFKIDMDFLEMPVSVQGGEGGQEEGGGVYM